MCIYCRPYSFSIPEGNTGFGSLTFNNVTFLYDYCYTPVLQETMGACVDSPYVSALQLQLVWCGCLLACHRDLRSELARL